MKMATVLESSEEDSMILRHNGTISVLSKNVITSCESFLTNAPITPNEVNLKYSKVLCLEVVFRKGKRKRGIWACKKRFLSLGEMQHTVEELERCIHDLIDC